MELFRSKFHAGGRFTTTNSSFLLEFFNISLDIRSSDTVLLFLSFLVASLISCKVKSRLRSLTSPMVCYESLDIGVEIRGDIVPLILGIVPIALSVVEIIQEFEKEEEIVVTRFVVTTNPWDLLSREYYLI